MAALHRAANRQPAGGFARSGGDPGILRLMFPDAPQHDDDALEEISWDEWLQAFDDNGLALIYESDSNFNKLVSWMEPIDKGKQLVFTYVPGTGTIVEVNGVAKGTLPGKATADAIVATWIGPKPGPGDDFKKEVLGR